MNCMTMCQHVRPALMYGYKLLYINIYLIYTYIYMYTYIQYIPVVMPWYHVYIMHIIPGQNKMSEIQIENWFKHSTVGITISALNSCLLFGHFILSWWYKQFLSHACYPACTRTHTRSPIHTNTHTLPLPSHSHIFLYTHLSTTQYTRPWTIGNPVTLSTARLTANHITTFTPFTTASTIWRKHER